MQMNQVVSKPPKDIFPFFAISNVDKNWLEHPIIDFRL